MTFDSLDLTDSAAYLRWREQKIRLYENNAHQCVIKLGSSVPNRQELNQILTSCQDFNYCIYQLEDSNLASKGFVKSLGFSLGLERLDGNLCSDEDNISSIQIKTVGRRAGYIPYTDKPLTWHTDGYYNEPSKTIFAMILHCVCPAEQGGDNLMLDHEMAYIQLRDENEQFIHAFLQPDVLTIPPNIEQGKEIRGAQSGAVFTVNPLNAHLHMRYSARTRNIQWKDDALTQEAVDCMKGLLNTNNPYVLNYRMCSGEGIIANNVLHNRTAFIDSDDENKKRLLYRARYYDRIKAVESE